MKLLNVKNLLILLLWHVSYDVLAKQVENWRSNFLEPSRWVWIDNVGDGGIAAMCDLKVDEYGLLNCEIDIENIRLLSSLTKSMISNSTLKSGSIYVTDRSLVYYGEGANLIKSKMRRDRDDLNSFRYGVRATLRTLLISLSDSANNGTKLGWSLGFWSSATTAFFSIFGLMTKKVHFSSNYLSESIPEVGLIFQDNKNMRHIRSRGEHTSLFENSVDIFSKYSSYIFSITLSYAMIGGFLGIGSAVSRVFHLFRFPSIIIFRVKDLKVEKYGKVNLNME